MPGSNGFSSNPDSGEYRDVPQASQAEGSQMSSGGSHLIGPILSFIDGFINRAYNQRQARESRQWQEDMWNKANEYSSPSAQIARYQEAGLNPYLLYDKGNSNVAAAMPSASAGAHSSHQIDYMAGLAQVQNAKLLGLQASHQETENAFQETMLLKEFAEMDSRTFMNYAATHAKSVETSILVKDLLNYDERFSNEMSEIRAKVSDYSSQDVYRKAQIIVEQSRNRLEDWYHKELVRLGDVQNEEIRNQNIRVLQQNYNLALEKLNQADDHLQRNLEFQENENKKGRKFQYWNMGVNAFTDVITEAMRDVTAILTFGISNIGNKSSVPGTVPDVTPSVSSDTPSHYPHWNSEEEYYKHLHLNR